MTKQLSIILFTFLLLQSGVFGAELTVDEKQELVSYYREWSKLLHEFPDRPEVHALFYDVDKDGVTEALATSYGSIHEDGCLWTVFRRGKSNWEPLDSQMNGVVERGNAVFGRKDEFYILTTTTGSNLVIIWKWYDNLAEGGRKPPKISAVSILDGKRLHLTEPGTLEDIIAYTGYSDAFVELQRLEVESFSE